MRSIWKYDVGLDDYFSIDMPKGAKILTIQNQQDRPRVWELVNSKAQTKKYNFRLFGTGQPLDDCVGDYQYI